MLASRTSTNVPVSRPAARRRRLVAGLCVASSAAALAAIFVYFEGGPARAAAAAARAELGQQLPPLLKAPLSAPRRAGQVAVAAATALRERERGQNAETSAETPAEQPAALTVPDLKNKRLSAARREARKLGLVVVARDDDGDRVGADVALFYRVRRQLTQAGIAAAPGDKVEVRVREIGATAEGY